MTETKPTPPAGATLAELKALAPDRPGFVLAQLEASATVNQAREALALEQAREAMAEVARLKAELADAKAKPRGADRVPMGGSAGQARQGFNPVQLAREKRDQLFPQWVGDQFGRGMRQAMSAVVRDNAEAYAAWRMAGGR